jgi:type I restriction enzyme S subunit
MKPWPEMRLGKLVKIKHGFAFRGEHFSDRGDFIVLTPGNVHPKGGLKLKGEKETYYTGDFPRAYILTKGDLVVVMTDLTQDASILGGAMLIDRDNLYLHNQRLGLVSHTDEIDRRFLYQYFNWQFFRDQVKASSNGATVKHTSPSRIYQCRIFHPPVPIQRKLAAVLSAYDELLENNSRRIVLLEKLAEEVYREWFVRLRFPGHEKVKVLKGVPQGWAVEKLGSILELCYGKALKEDDRISGDFPVYGSSGIVGTRNEALVKTSGLIVGRKGNVGSIFYSGRAFSPIDTVYFVKSKLPNSFLYFLLRSMNFINNDAAVPGLNRKQAYSNQFFFPSAPLVEKFRELADPLFDMKHNLARQNDKLIVARGQLLPRLISGKLSVEHLDIQFPPSMMEELKATPPAAAYA